MILSSLPFFPLFQILGAAYLLCSPVPPPIVETKYGLIEGTYDGVSRDGRNFYQFRGIQYAVVIERFKPSVNPQSWSGTKSAKEFGPACNKITVHGNEDCLYLNVYTRTISSRNGSLLPVALFVHGGSFQEGSGDYVGPNYLIDEDIVFVAIGYRLGILGFMSTGDEASPGNYGLKDQVMALKWIQENIHAFGGDKSKVTLFGQSAGSASVTYHLVSPMSKDLFRHAIAQSGSFLDPWAFTRKPLRHARKLTEHLNCNDANSTSAIVECLKDIPASILADPDLAGNLTYKFFKDPIAGFGPTIEPLIGNGSNTFLSSSPYQLLKSGNVTKVPLLAGVVKEEGIDLWAAYLLFYNSTRAIEDRAKMQANFTGIAPAAFYFDEKAPSNHLGEIASKVENFYFGSDGFDLDNESTFPRLSNLYSDRMFVASLVRFMNLYSKQAPTYPYLYTFNKFVGMDFGWEDLHKNYSLDATHGAELDMIFSPLHSKVRVDPLHDQVSKSVTKLWVSFIKDGYPSSTYGSERSFPPIQPDQGLQQWYSLDIDTALSENIFKERITFWENLELSDDDFENCYC